MAWLEITHETRYDYAAPVSPAMHLAHLMPLTDTGQRVARCVVEVEPAPDERRDAQDVFGNLRSTFAVIAPHRRLTVRAVSVVGVAARFAGLQPAAGPAWDALVARLRYVALAPFEPAVEFTLPSPRVPRLEVLRAWARPSFSPGRSVAEAAIDLMHRLHTEFRYEGGATGVDTPLAESFARRRGVCQDFAHVLAGALRMLGLPARYVSGYLLTTPAAGEPALVGADASHAWVQVWAPGTPGVPADGWLDLDPTNDLVPAAGHVRLAVGRDYGDVAPLRGVIRGGGAHTLSVGVHTRPLAGPDDAPDEATAGSPTDGTGVAVSLAGQEPS
ncbi:MAG: transglutaminase family protein [Burkholderiaceae bacterium]|nr:transglutaminase family protein [Burkholderiaceae bacterium]